MINNRDKSDMSFKGIPKRLIYVSLMNVVNALLGLILLGVLLTGKDLPSDGVPGNISAIFSAALALSLIWQSIRVFSSSIDNRRKLFAVALIFYGVLIFQQLWALYLYQDIVTEQQMGKVYRGVARAVIELGLNWWALFSVKTAQFFSERRLSR